MQTRELGIAGAFEVTARVFPDERGSFHEWFRPDLVRAATGTDVVVAQANCSVSSAGTLRGIHLAQVPPGQAKYVSCLAGSAWDVVVDLRVGSSTYGRWEAVELVGGSGRSVYVPEGVGHGFLALEDATVVAYLCSTTYDPVAEFGVDPFDRDLGIAWPTIGAGGRPLTWVLSDKDRTAPSVAVQRAAGRLGRD